MSKECKIKQTFCLRAKFMSRRHNFRHMERQRLNIHLPIDLYNKIQESEYGNTEAIIKGLKLLFDPPVTTDQKVYIDQLKEQLLIKDRKIEELKKEEKRNELMEKIIEPQLLEAKESLIGALQVQIEDLKGQLKVKDSQLENKDSQLEKQAVHIQSLIHENSKLNLKLLPESTETKKPWWRFW